MMEEDKFAYVVSVPEDNGYTRQLFERRVVEYVEMLTHSHFEVPTPSTIMDTSSLNQGQEPTGHPSSDKEFGVVASFSELRREDINRNQALIAMIIHRHYGLIVTPAVVIYGEDRANIRFFPALQ